LGAFIEEGSDVLLGVQISGRIEPAERARHSRPRKLVEQSVKTLLAMTSTICLP
jgi:hypothetical protein